MAAKNFQFGETLNILETPLGGTSCLRPDVDRDLPYRRQSPFSTPGEGARVLAVSCVGGSAMSDAKKKVHRIQRREDMFPKDLASQMITLCSFGMSFQDGHQQTVVGRDPESCDPDARRLDRPVLSTHFPDWILFMSVLI